MSTDAAMRTAAAGTVVEHFLSAMDRHADLPLARAHRDGAWRDTTFAELRRSVERIACGLVALGVEPHDRVALLAGTRPEWTACDYGIQCAGATVVPIYPSSTPADCLHILRDSGAVAAIVEDEEHLEALRPLLADLPDLREIVLIDAVGERGVASLADLERRGAEHLAADAGAFAARTAAVRADDPCTFVYTSGTTGSPKGCVILHRNYRAMIEMTVGTNTFVGPGSVVYLYLPLAHVFARLTQYHAVAAGSVIAYTRGVERIADDLLETRPHVLPSVPRVFEKVRTAVLAKGESGPALRRRLFAFALATGDGSAGCGSGARRRAGCSRRSTRSPTDSSSRRCGSASAAASRSASPAARRSRRTSCASSTPAACSCSRATASPSRRPRSRQPRRRLPLRQRRQAVPGRRGADRATTARSSCAARTCSPATSAAEATADVRSCDGWLHTGDVGRSTPNGFLEITDRKKDIIVTAGGKNVAPQNIENALKGVAADRRGVRDRRPPAVPRRARHGRPRRGGQLRRGRGRRAAARGRLAPAGHGGDRRADRGDQRRAGPLEQLRRHLGSCRSSSRRRAASSRRR